VVEFCGFSESASIVGILYLGYATQSADAPPRPEPPLSMITT